MDETLEINNSPIKVWTSDILGKGQKDLRETTKLGENI